MRASQSDRRINRKDARLETRQQLVAEPSPQSLSLHDVVGFQTRNTYLQLIDRDGRDKQIGPPKALRPDDETRVGTTVADLAQFRDDVRIEQEHLVEADLSGWKAAARKVVVQIHSIVGGEGISDAFGRVTQASVLFNIEEYMRRIPPVSDDDGIFRRGLLGTAEVLIDLAAG